MGLTPLERDPREPIQLVTAGQLCGELQINRRTLGRRVRGRIRGEADSAAEDAPEVRVMVVEDTHGRPIRIVQELPR
jgi:hypothetical protein